MIRADSTLPVPAAAPRAAGGVPAAAAGMGGGPLYGEIAAEVGRFIADGGTPFRARAGTTAAGAASAGAADPLPDRGATASEQRAFVAALAPGADVAAARLGVDPALVIGHAALESGWGQRPLRDSTGAPAHNLFGLKAGGHWQGAVVRAATSEYVDGARVPAVETFRRYGDLAAGLADYASLLESPRYAGAAGAGADAATFARALATGGYATDPAYAAKLEAVVQQVRRIAAAEGTAGVPSRRY